MEDLNIASMANMKHWGRRVNDLGWTGFLRSLEYVASKYGAIVHKVDRWFPSSKLCDCGYIIKHLKLRDREWICPKCGANHFRDLHAAKNIYRQGIAELGSISKTCRSVAEAGMVR